jgi:Ca2+/Na+ antiporter
MQVLWLAKVEDDTIFIITLGVVLVVVIAYLVLGRDDTIRLQEDNEEPKNNAGPEFQEKVIHRLDRSNDLLTSIRNSILFFIVLVVLLPVLFLLLTRGCNAG